MGRDDQLQTYKSSDIDKSSDINLIYNFVTKMIVHQLLWRKVCDENVLGTEIIYKSKPTLQYNYVLITIQNDFDIIP